MTVKQLIAKLGKYPAEATVRIYADEPTQEAEITDAKIVSLDHRDDGIVWISCSGELP